MTVAVPAARPIRRLLVANRGELVVRIARTCRRLGVTSLALVPDDQARAWWAGQADEVVPLPATYLDADAVLDAARGARADAIHPGYGFLAENAGFAEAVVAAGMTWVGPPASAMRTLGDKRGARRLAESLGVPIVVGYDGEDQTDQRLLREAERIGLPLLVKPSAGGGGKGMHVVRVATGMEEVLARARREAKGAFGDETLILERYLERPRHVEVQLLFDAHGHGVHLGERDCSLQRRHQKVVEESPSPAADEPLRQRLGDAALRLADAAGYVGAGTAEFLLDDRGSFFFLEVNARLQVEHPVTELVTGRDLVEDQLHIAAGEGLGLAQADISLAGHAVEARIYAEDPWEGFLPATGEVLGVQWPVAEGIRVDAGVGVGDVIDTRYDPLLAKILAHGASREEAIDRLVRALRETAVTGVTTNRGFLARLLDAPDMRAGEARTDTIDRIRPAGDDAELVARSFSAAATLLARSGSGTTVPTGFRLNAAQRVVVRIGRDERATDADPAALDGVGWASDGAVLHLDLEGRASRASLADPPTVDLALAHAQREHGSMAAVTAPMPGRILAVRVAQGDEVAAGQTLVVLEAMKMENAVVAPAAASIARVLVEAGQQVQRGDGLVELV